MSRREFVNELPDYNGENLLQACGEVDSQLYMQLDSEVRKNCATILAIAGQRSTSNDDHSVYTGTAGQALLCLLLHERSGDVGHVRQCLRLVEPCLERLRCKTRDCTFLCGDSGPLCIAAVAYHRLGPEHYGKRDRCVSRVAGMHVSVAAEASLPDELLYGRAGYLYGLLFIERCIGAGSVDRGAIEAVCKAMLASGERLQAKMRTQCLMYSWYGELYTGAAHGHAGILYLLLKLKARVPELDARGQLRQAVDYMLGIRLPTGNCPCTLDDRTDELVHWCHGAPGWVYMFAAAYEAYGDSKYLQAARDCAEVTWTRGLLRKGYGICHGVSGNAYAFLLLYRLTGEARFLHRACQFARWCFAYGQRGCRTPDTPHSLFEGLAGTTYFLLDLQVPGKARFPAFEL